MLFSLIAGVSFYQYSTSANSYADAGAIPDHEQWYSLQWQGHKVGYLKESWSQHAEHLQWSQLLEIKGIARGKKFNRLSKEVLQFDLEFPYQLLGGSWFVDAEQQKEHISFMVKQNQLQIQLPQGIKKSVLAYPENWNAQQLWAPQRAAAVLNNTLEATSFQFSRWDMQKLQPVDFSFDFGDVNLAGEIQAVSQQSDSNHSSLWIFNARGKLLSRSLGRSLILQQSGRADALQLSSVDVFSGSLLELDKPLGVASNIARLELEMGEVLAQFSGDGVVTTTQQFPGGFLQIGLPGDYEKRQSETFLQQNQRYPDSDRVKRIAKSLVEAQQSTLDKAQAIMNFVAEFVEDEDILTELSVSDILDSGKGDCSEHALLFVALSRAAGIPAREANGLLYLGDTEQKYSAHVWAEVEIDGNWISIDPTWRKVKLDAGYIRVYGEQSSIKTTLLAISGKTLRVKKLSYL